MYCKESIKYIKIPSVLIHLKSSCSKDVEYITYILVSCYSNILISLCFSDLSTFLLSQLLVLLLTFPASKEISCPLSCHSPPLLSPLSLSFMFPSRFLAWNRVFPFPDTPSGPGASWTAVHPASILSLSPSL